MRAKEFIKDWIIMPQSIKPMGLIHKKGTGPNNRFDFKNKYNNRANEEENNKEIHIVALQKNQEKNLTALDPKKHIYKSGTWDIPLEKAKKLIGGQIYFHDTKAEPSWHGGNILDVVPGKRGEPAKREDGVEFILQTTPETKTPHKWQGAEHGRAWMGVTGEDAMGVGTITKQNTTKDVKPGETQRQLKKLHLR